MASLLGGFAGLGGGSIGTAAVDLVLNKGLYDAQLAETEAKTAASTANMQKGFKGFQQQVRNSFSGAQLAMVGFGAVAAVAIAKGISETTDWAAQVRALMRVTGQTAEQASALAGAAQTLGLDVTKLTQGFGLLAKNIVNGSKNLTKYGIATKDAQGNILPFDTVLKNVSDTFAALPAGPAQAAFAMNVFGRSGKDLIPILQKGSAGLAELEQQAKAAGLVMSGADVTAAKNLSVAQRELGEAFRGAAIQLGTAFIPVMTAIAHIVTKVVELVQLVPRPVLAMGAAFLAVNAALLVVSKGFVAIAATAPEAAGGIAIVAGAIDSLAGPITVLIGLWALFESAQRAANAQTQEWIDRYKAQGLTLVDAKAKLAAFQSAIDDGRRAIGSNQIPALEAYIATLEHVNTTTDDARVHLTALGHAVRNFADMTRKELQDWRAQVAQSITDTFLTLGSKTKDIFNVTQRQLGHDFAAMLRDALRFKHDLAELLALKPGSFGLSRTDLQRFEVFMQQQGPGYVDAFVNANHSKQQRWINDWQRAAAAVHSTIQNAIPRDGQTITVSVIARSGGGRGGKGSPVGNTVVK